MQHSNAAMICTLLIHRAGLVTAALPLTAGPFSLHSETNETAFCPPSLPFQFFTTASSPWPPLPFALSLYSTNHKSISARLQVLPTPTPKWIFLIKTSWLCWFLSSLMRYRLFWRSLHEKTSPWHGRSSDYSCQNMTRHITEGGLKT